MSDEVSNIKLIQQILKGRREFYLTLAGLYFKPLTQEQIENMAQTDYTAFGAGEPLLEAGFNDITRFLRKRHSGTRQMLATDFTGSFGGTTPLGGKVAVPYASVFLSAEGLLNQRPRSEVLGIYKRAQLRVTDRSTPDDHLSFELEFLSVLSDRTVTAVEKGAYAEALEQLELSRDFIKEQILSWFPAFSQLAAQIVTTRFYRGVLRVTEGYLKLDQEVLDDLIEEVAALER
ncbi:MAG: molecular chaperone TorD family protein [Coriobacteriales bacterium]|jgi:TorA maturation chaperone TorD|nr:molecular chaperone TorD family protein [Coriobacteriales bacterium]